LHAGLGWGGGEGGRGGVVAARRALI